MPDRLCTLKLSMLCTNTCWRRASNDMLTQLTCTSALKTYMYMYIEHVYEPCFLHILVAICKTPI